MEIINYKFCDANNHILNTLLIKLFFLTGNHSLFVARLPNVLAFIMYLVFSYKLTSKYLPSFVRISCFLLLLLNPFLLDFFSIARGYGLSLGFLMASIYYAIRYADKGKTTHIWQALGCGAMGVLCNFSLLNYWVSLLLIINGIALFSKVKHNFKTTFLVSLSVAFMLLAILYEPIRKLRINNSLYYGGNDNFYTDTLVSLAKYSFYSTESNGFIQGALMVFMVLVFVSVLVSFFVKSDQQTSKNIIFAITILCILSVIAQHYLLGTLYLIDRTALFFYPLFILLLCFSLSVFTGFAKNIVLAFVTLSFAINFVNHANFYKTATWYFDAHTVNILNVINQKGKTQYRVMKIDFSWPFQSSVGYYLKQNKKNYPFIEIVKNREDREDCNENSDYYIYLSKSLEKVGYEANNQKINAISKDTLLHYKAENIMVFENITSSSQTSKKASHP